MGHSNFRSRVWLPALRTTGLSEIRVHDLRLTAATFLIAEGAHPLAVKTHLGHSSIQVTMDVYGHLYPSELEELADRLDARHRAAADSVAPLVRPGKARAAFATRERPCKRLLTWGFLGGPGRTRTCDRRIMSPLL